VTTTRAAVLTAAGKPLEVVDIELHPPTAGQVRVRLVATGVCHSDLSLRDGVIPQPTPAVLGHEGAGVVEEVGPGVETVAPGDHVIISWVTPCRRCRFCLGGQPWLCERGIDHAFAGHYATWNGEGLWCGLGTATFAQQTVVPEGAVVPIDPSFPLAHAALIGCGVVTGVGAVVNAARVAPGDTVAVVGCGGVGLAAVQGARLAGATRIVAVDRVAAKLDLAAANGATDVVDAAAGDPVATVHEILGGGVDHSFEVVGRADTIAQAYAMARRGGAVTIVGAGRFDETVAFPVMGMMVDAKTIRGCVYGSTDPQRDFPRMVALQQEGRLDLELLITKRITLDEVDAALDAMSRGEGARSVVEL
jgi:S-(hydroxymethyl)glutathione dehydrogenase/alcohol dehydrogenase